MNTKIKKRFRMWRFVECVSHNKIWADNGNYSNILEIGKIYFVIDNTIRYGDLKNGPQAIRVKGEPYWHAASNFKKSNFFKWLFKK